MDIADLDTTHSDTDSTNMRTMEDLSPGQSRASSWVQDEDFDDPPGTLSCGVRPRPEANNNQHKETTGGLDEVDIEELLARPRHRVGMFRRQNNSLNKARSTLDAPEFVKRLNAFEEAKAGSRVVFCCRAQAFPRPTIRWYQDDEEITDLNNRVYQEEKDNGEVRLIINDCRKSDEAAYKCKAENAEGVASTTGYLSVTGDMKEKSLAAQPRKNAQHAVSVPPRLKCLIEQKSLELREEEECSFLPPSPIHEYVASFKKNSLRTTAKQKSPSIPRLEDIKKGAACNHTWEQINEEPEEDSGSDTSVDSQDFDRIPTLSDSDDIFECELIPETKENLGSVVKHQNGDPDANISLANEHSGLGHTYSSTASQNGRVAAAVSSPARKRKKSTAKVITAVTATANMQIIDSFAFAKLQQPPVFHRCAREVITIPENQETKRIHFGPVLYGPDPDVARNERRFETTSATTTRKMPSSDMITHTTPEFPWLFALASSSVATLFATATEMSPVMFVILLALISLLSFRILLSTKLQCTP